jgi:NAD(P)-dependent dehydrogenase (short-subunit alcohol dehydrogenase family)
MSTARRTLVTGAGRGLGLEFVRQLLRRGDTIVATARRPDRASELRALADAHRGRLHVLALDVADSERFPDFEAEVAERVPALDLLINNAGVLAGGERFGKLRADNLLEAFRTNTVGPLLLTQAVTPLLHRGRHPLVLNISSILGSIGQTSNFYTPSYAISKAALNMAGVLLGHALDESGIRVVNLHPGWVRTQMGGDSATLDKDAAVESILQTLENLPLDVSGIFVDRFGSALPW